MEALSVLMPLMQMGMGGSQSILNTGLGLIPTIMSWRDRLRAQYDPLMRQFSGIIANRYNQAVGENLYGDPYGTWGGMFGTNDAGQSIGVGEAQARAIYQMMQNNPALSGLENYQTLAQQERGPVADSTAGLASLMGHPSQFTGGYDQPNFIPATADMGAALNTDFSGSPAPRDTTWQTVDERLAGRGGIGSGVIDALAGLDPQGLSKLLQFGTALANRGGGGGGLGVFGGGGRPGVEMWGSQPVRTGGGAPYTGGIPQFAGQRLGLNHGKSAGGGDVNDALGFWQSKVPEDSGPVTAAQFPGALQRKMERVWRMRHAPLGGL